MPVSPAEAFEELKRYVRFGEQDAARLRALCGHARGRFEAIVSEFYERAREHDAAHAVFRDEAQIARLHGSLVAWLERVLMGPYDAAYAEKSARIGRVHVEVGLPQRYMYSAMTLFRVRLFEIARETLGDEEVLETGHALSRILDLELALMNGEYRRALMERTERLERQARNQLLGTLQRTERRYVHAVDIAGVVMIGLDAAGRIQLFNREATRVTGYPVDEAQAMSFADMIDHTACDFQGAWSEALRANAPIVRALTCTLRTRSGKLRHLETYLSRAPEPGETADEAIVILTGRDVTEERALSARVRRAERLATAGTLAAGLAHEIRNPLNGAQLHLTYLDRALERSSNEELRETVGVVTAEIARLSALVSDYLQFARPSAVALQPTRLQELCSRAVAIVTHDGVHVSADLPSLDVIADVDAGRVEQVLINLLQNAVEAASHGGGTVKLALRREPHTAVISVTDDGPGVQPDAPIFDAFYSTTPSGTGLGLAIVHRIVQDHAGTIELDSAPGNTVFRVRLPLTNIEQSPGLS